MKLLWIATAFATAASMPCLVVAQTPKPIPETSAFMEAALRHDALKIQENRDKLVTSVRNYCAVLSERLPRNSPSETEWLDSEVAAGGDRLQRVIQTPEWARRQVLNFVTVCDQYTLIYANGPSSRAFALAGLTHAFTRFAPDAEIYSERAGIKDEGLSIVILSFSTPAIAYASMAQAAINE